MAQSNCLERMFHDLNTFSSRNILEQLWEQHGVFATGGELLGDVARARGFLRRAGPKKGDRCVLLAPNSIRWVAFDLAAMSEGLIVVPLYSRQAPNELVAMMKDCSPALIVCSDDTSFRDSIAQHWPDAPRIAVFDEIFVSEAEDVNLPPVALAENDAITIIYTSGTSGEAKGVMLTIGNINHMLSCTSQRLDSLMQGTRGQDRVFHYLPFCFAGSWIMLLTCLLRGSLLMMSTDLNRLAMEMRSAAAHYSLNVPVLLERMRSGVDRQFAEFGGIVDTIYRNAKEAWFRQDRGERRALDRFWLAWARAILFSSVRKRMIGANLKALICGSAPLARETQLFFAMLGVPVLQVYGLTETTAICTMDDPGHVEPGRVGPAIPGVEMKVAENGEILVRGPNVFRGYWNRAQATADALRDGWFHTGDQGEVNEAGNWRISGRVKNLIILSSGHNVAPEPIEDQLLGLLPDAKQVMLLGHGRGFVAALVTGAPMPEQVQFAVDEVNRDLPHYKRVRAFQIVEQPFTVENGMLTANGKLKRGFIAAQLQQQIEELYRDRQSA
jgi:long-chain acyl-CoA synthetase